MIRNSRFFVIFTVVLFMGGNFIRAQENEQQPLSPVTSGEFLLSPPKQNCIAQDFYDLPHATGNLLPKAQSTAFPMLDWPIATTLNNGLNLRNYVDDDVTSGIKDYMGNPHSYNGHNGTDIGPTGFRSMDHGIPILAAADGVVIAMEYSRIDRNIGPTYPDEGNFVIVEHSGGTQARYWHLRKNSITVNVGETVVTGQVLGLMGSSGFSTEPHLHFELGEFLNDVYTKRDPWNGTYNTLPSLWKNQEAYVGNLFLIHDADVFTETAAGGDIFNIPLSFFKEELIQPAVFSANEPYLVMWLRLQGLPGDSYTIEIRRPDASLYGNIIHTLSNKVTGWHYWGWFLSGTVSPAEYGTWTGSVLINGNTVQQVSFEVGAATVYSPRFGPIAGRSFRVDHTIQKDTLRVSLLGGPVTYSLLNTPNFVSLEDDSVVIISPGSLQLPRSVYFQALATDIAGRTDTMWYHGVNPTSVSGSNSAFRVERVSGNVYADGSFISGGADLAERIDASGLVEPGDVVELDPDKPEHYRQANGSSRLIAGVIATTPGFILGNRSNEKEAAIRKVGEEAFDSTRKDRSMLALVGRVPVKATTENGAIRPGDLLTVASKPGYVMRCVEPNGYNRVIIGKALGGLECGDGKILVLVMAH